MAPFEVLETGISVGFYLDTVRADKPVIHSFWTYGFDPDAGGATRRNQDGTESRPGSNDLRQ